MRVLRERRGILRGSPYQETGGHHRRKATMGKTNDGAKTQNNGVMRGMPSETHQWQATRSETFTEVGWRAVCGESRKHGSEGGQRFLRVRVAYPTIAPCMGMACRDADGPGKAPPDYRCISTISTARCSSMV